MADILGIHFLVSVDGVALVFDEASPEFPLENDERKPANSPVPVTHYTGKRCKIGFKGGLQGQVLPRGGAAVDVVVSVPSGFDTTTLPLDWQDLIAGSYTNFCVSESVKPAIKQGVVEYDFEIMSDCVEIPDDAAPDAA